MSLDDLIIDLAGNKMADANTKFRELMSARVNDALDAKKIELAKSLGFPEEEETEITDVEDDEIELEASEEEQEELETETEEEDDEDVQGDENTPQ